jgi:enoyl-CoA hydratase/carnithine racemase
MVSRPAWIRDRAGAAAEILKMSEESILFEKSGHVATLTINRPYALNAMDTEAHERLSSYLDRCNSDEDIRVIVLTGTGERAFSVGRDLKAMVRENALTGSDKLAMEECWMRMRRITDRHDLNKPHIARVNGLALGGGFEIALACDIVIAADTAEFALPEPKRGLIPFAGGVHRLPRQIPLKAAMGHLLTGRPMTSARAYELGLVNAVVPFASLDEEVTAWVKDILACAPLAIASIKQCAMAGLQHSLPKALVSQYPLEVLRRSSQDSLEGPRAFAEKRAPVWTGR